jgi:hypothetical protein
VFGFARQPDNLFEFFRFLSFLIRLDDRLEHPGDLFRTDLVCLSSLRNLDDLTERHCTFHGIAVAN